MFGDMENTKAITAKLNNLFRLGTVTSLQEDKALARVVFEDRDNMESANLPVLVRNSLKNKDYWMPDIGEQVLCLFLPIGMEAGFIVGSYYVNDNTPPVTAGSKRAVEFEDGTTVEYDREAHRLTVDVPESGGELVINTQAKVTVNSPAIDLGEDGSLEPSVLGDQLASWIESTLKPWLDSHNHIGNLGAPTGPAQAAPSGPFNPGSGAAGGGVYSQKNRNQ